jgi:ASC-1-like (ASCH) protein
MMDKRFLIIMGFVLATFFLSEWLIPDSDLKHPISFTLTVGIGALVFWLTRTKMSAKEKATRNKIEQLKNAGQELRLEQEANFNDQDLTILYKHKRFITWMVILGMLVLNGMIIGVMQVTADLNNKLLWQALVFSVVTGGLGWFHVYYQRKFLNLIRTGKKTIIRGIVTHKRIDGDETDTHFLEIDSLSVFVEKKIYDKYEIGDGIEIHVFKPHHNMLLYEAKIETMSLK